MVPAALEWSVADDIRISDDPAELDRDRVYRWIGEESYWAKGRSRERQHAAIDGSWNFGAYDTMTGEQVGFARVVTDKATYAWVCDVYVDRDARGRGVGKSLMAAIVEAMDTLGVQRVVLATADAHGLYEQCGFSVLDQPDRWMIRRPVV
jgi:GNAT superfamily N-acetyltransferase